MPLRTKIGSRCRKAWTAYTPCQRMIGVVMNITLVTTSFNDEVHATFNDKRTGCGINLLKPEIHSKALMPALQSVWFVPHVIVYMFSYAMMGAVTLFAVYLWFRKSPDEATDKELGICDGLVRVGWSFLTLGMTMGALWAKEAWGDYWSWDPKETWAFATWLSYLFYLHLRPSCKHQDFLFAWLIFSFILLQMCWWGINFLPSAQGISIHTY